MRSVVLVKQVPSTDHPRRLDAQGRLVRTEGEQVLDEIGERGLEFVLSHRDATRSVEVVAMTMGPPSARAALRYALSMGADRGVHVCDDRLAGADQVQTALVLAEALRAQRPDLIVTGTSSTDGGGGALPGLLSQMLGMPLLAGLVSAGVSERDAHGDRVAAEGVVRVTADLPAILAITDQFPEARLPSLRGVIGAKRKPVDTLGLAEVGIASTGPTTAVVSVRENPRRAAGVRILDDGTGAARLADFLVDQHLI